MKIKKFNKIGFKNIGIGLLTFFVLAIIFRLIGIFSDECAVGLGVGVMAGCLMLSCKESYLAGFNDAQKDAGPDENIQIP